MAYHNHLINPPCIIFTAFDSEGKTNANYLASFNDEKLMRELARAVDREDYESAVLYRDELKRRNPGKQDFASN